jgi:hypothetical protein
MTRYQIGIKVRHENPHNSITNFVVAKQVIVKIINEFFNFSPK